MKRSLWITALLVIGIASLAAPQAMALTATTTTVTATPNPVVIGSKVTYTVTVVGSGAPLTGEAKITVNGYLNSWLNAHQWCKHVCQNCAGCAADGRGRRYVRGGFQQCGLNFGAPLSACRGRAGLGHDDNDH